ncbi:MAG: family transposase [Gammaproteobacteria bacterium]|nr:family transposase [Gammaproteobacteria bacterium]
MKKTRFSEDDMVKILREADLAPVAEVAKKHGISDQTIYRKRFGKLEAVDVKRLRHLEAENAKLKKVAAPGAWARHETGFLHRAVTVGGVEYQLPLPPAEKPVR